MQVKDTVRLSKKSQETLLKYHDDVNKAIERMDSRVNEIGAELIKSLAVTDSLQKVTTKHWTNTGSQLTEHDEEYWAKVNRIVREAMKPETFKPAGNRTVTQDYAKKHGPITTAEEYVEPVGRQGRDIR